ncbi:MAG: hypothetical protein JSS49_28260 [Planctomycetes bacterium]|nr:hypothetical protein [Planctomycetota bacterium]
MDPNEWCVLLTLAKWGSYDIRHVVRSSTILAKSVLKLRISSQDAYQAILRCLESGVLVKLDEKALRLRTTVCVSPTPLVTDNHRTSRLDFTEKEARLLTELGPTIHGDAWLESWVVEREIFRRVHHYAWNLLDVASVFEEYSRDSAATVKIGPIQEIGPWCLYWWKRFDKGYRLEFDVTSE